MVRLLQVLLFKAWISKIDKKNISVLALKANRGLAEVSGLIESDEIRPVIDGPYSLDQVVDAVRLFEAGSQKGRIVLTV